MRPLGPLACPQGTRHPRGISRWLRQRSALPPSPLPFQDGAIGLENNSGAGKQWSSRTSPPRDAGRTRGTNPSAGVAAGPEAAPAAAQDPRDAVSARPRCPVLPRPGEAPRILGGMLCCDGSAPGCGEAAALMRERTSRPPGSGIFPQSLGYAKSALPPRRGMPATLPRLPAAAGRGGTQAAKPPQKTQISLREQGRKSLSRCKHVFGGFCHFFPCFAGLELGRSCGCSQALSGCGKGFQEVVFREGNKSGFHGVGQA